MFWTVFFLPAAPSISIRYELVNDDDYTCPSTRTLSGVEEQVATSSHDRLSNHIRLWKLLDPVPKLLNPEDFNGAAGEGLILIVILSWILGAAFNMDNLNDNPLKDRFGYNNICVAWDEPPGLYPAAVLFNIPIYMQMRYACRDSLRAKLSGATARQVLITNLANAYVALSFAGVCLIFVVTPNVQPTLHTAFFLNLVIATYLGAAANFYEVDSKHHKKRSWVYMAIYGVLAAAVLVAGTIMLTMYKEEGRKRGPLPSEFTMVLDYSWFAFLACSAQNLPAAPSILVEYKLSNNEDYHDVDLQPLASDRETDVEDNKCGGTNIHTTCDAITVGKTVALDMPGNVPSSEADGS